MTFRYTCNDTPTNRRASEDDEEEETKTFPIFGAKRKPYQQYEQTFTAQHVHFYLSEEIADPNLYTDMIHRITTAGDGDVIFIHLNTPGGQLDTGVQIINAMQNSQAKIVTVLESMAYSLGTLIFLAGDEMVVNDHCMIMFHNFKGGIVGKGNELTSQLEATMKWFTALAKKIYIPFMTEEEFARINRGEDLWMHSPEIRRRLDKMMKIMEEEANPVKKPRKPRKLKTEKEVKKEVKVDKAE